MILSGLVVNSNKIKDSGDVMCCFDSNFQSANHKPDKMMMKTATGSF